MSQLFGRIIKLIVGDDDDAVTIPTDFKIVIDLKKFIGASSSEGSVTVFNLADDTKEKIRASGKKIQVFAGYGDDYVLLHFGDVLRTAQVDEGANVKTIIYLGGNIYKTNNAIFTKSYNSSVSVRQIVSDALPSFDLPFDKKVTDLIPADATIPNFSFVGKTTDMLSSLLEPLNLKWFENNGQSLLSEKGKASGDDKDNNVIILNSNTGLIKTVTTTDRGINATCLLNPQLQPGGIVKIESNVEQNASFNTFYVTNKKNSNDGLYKITQASYNGDNWDGKFEALLQCVPFDESQEAA
jgi:hypothetical protein